MIVRGAVHGVVVEHIAEADADQPRPVELVRIDGHGERRDQVPADGARVQHAAGRRGRRAARAQPERLDAHAQLLGPPPGALVEPHAGRVVLPVVRRRAAGEKAHDLGAGFGLLQPHLAHQGGYEDVRPVAGAVGELAQALARRLRDRRMVAQAERDGGVADAGAPGDFPQGRGIGGGTGRIRHARRLRPAAGRAIHFTWKVTANLAAGAPAA